MEKLYFGKRLFISDYFTSNWTCPLPGVPFASVLAANVIVSIEAVPPPPLPPAASSPTHCLKGVFTLVLVLG